MAKTAHSIFLACSHHDSEIRTYVFVFSLYFLTLRRAAVKKMKKMKKKRNREEDTRFKQHNLPEVFSFFLMIQNALFRDVRKIVLGRFKLNLKRRQWQTVAQRRFESTTTETKHGRRNKRQRRRKKDKIRLKPTKTTTRRRTTMHPRRRR